jgi:hypothetical protein
LNELREYKGYAQNDIADLILNSNREVVKQFLDAYNKRENVIEQRLSWSYQNYDKEHVRNIFQGYMYLHPDSNRSTTEYIREVPEELYNILKECELPCEKIRVRKHVGYYSSQAGHSNVDVAYKEVRNDQLRERINKILSKYNSDIKYAIGVPLKHNFELIPSTDEPVFNTDLDKLSDSDLTTVVMIAILHSKSSNIYQVMKRMIKVIMRSKHFRNIIFGK